MSVFSPSNLPELMSNIITANTNGEANEIVLSPMVLDLSDYDSDREINPAPYTYNGYVNGFPVIRSDVTISGAGSGLTIITRTNDAMPYRLFLVAPEGILRLNNLTLQNGDLGGFDAGGGAVFVYGSLFMNDCKVGPNNHSNYGGAIQSYNDDSSPRTVEIHRCEFFDNTSDHDGSIANYANGTLSIYDSIVRDSDAAEGGAIFNAGTATISGCILSGNSSVYGGGIANFYGGTSTVQNCSIYFNSGNGSAVYNRLGTLTVTNSNITDNIPGMGGSFSVLNDDSSQLDVSNNWWGRVDGPYSQDIAMGPGPILADPWLQVPAMYDRRAAASHAIRTSRCAFGYFPVGPGDRTFTVKGSIGGIFRYPATVLSHTLGATGSAIFASEALYAGGHPMTLETPNSIGSCENANFTDSWRVCCGDSRGTTATWKRHEVFMQYFGQPKYGGKTIGTLTVGQLDPYIDYQTGAITNASALYTLFSTGALSGIQTGDYTFINSQPVSHGFIIVGWGPARNCIDALNADESGVPGVRVQFTYDKKTDTIPYVADFSYGFPGGRTGWVQDPRPRPFYCSTITILQAVLRSINSIILGYNPQDYTDRLGFDYARFDHTRWDFFHIPDKLAIDNENRRYTPTSACY